MDRRLDNIFINEKGRGLNYTPPSSGGGTHNYPPGDSRVMVVSIETPKVELDLYTAIQTEIKNKTIMKTEITALTK